MDKYFHAGYRFHGNSMRVAVAILHSTSELQKPFIEIIIVDKM